MLQQIENAMLDRRSNDQGANPDINWISFSDVGFSGLAPVPGAFINRLRGCFMPGLWPDPEDGWLPAHPVALRPVMSSV